MRTARPPLEPRQLAGALLLLGALVGALVALGTVSGLLLARRSHAAVPGTVVAVDQSCRGECRYRPVVEYAVGGERYGLIGAAAHRRVLFERGETVTVLVSRADPRRARLDHWSESAMPVAVGSGLAVFSGGAGWLLLRRRRN